MEIVLITPTPPDINAFGVRILSSILKEAGYQTRIIFLPGGIEHLNFDSSYIYQYSDHVLDQIASICKDADLIGFSFMSLYYDRADQVTKHLKERYPQKTVIWGGTHPTYRPEQCVDHCDLVCIGEGEHVIVQLAEMIKTQIDYTNLHSCCVRVDDKIQINPSYPMIDDLDSLPFADYDLVNHYVFDWTKDEVVPIDEREMKKQFLRMEYFNNQHLITYRTMSSRGCPHNCSYCASSAMKSLRRRSVDNTLDELEQIINRFGYIELISFFDDTFFAAPHSFFEEFRDKYKRRIGLPFHAQCSPTTLTKDRMDLLLDAGLFYTEMGIQSGSRKIQKLYRRVVSDQTVLDAGQLIHTARDRLMTPDYHIILDNPWETSQDIKDTLKLLLKMPGKFKLQISSLIFFPGTELNEKATAEGLLHDELNEVCRKPFVHPKSTYLNYLIYLSGFSIVPRGILQWLARDTFVRWFHNSEGSRAYDFLFFITARIRLVCRGLTALFHGDFKRIINHFRLVR